MTVRILCGDCMTVLRNLPDESVHCVVSSPPYWSSFFHVGGPMSLSAKEYHAGHDCDPGPCECRCGCIVQMGCRALSDLCSTCSLRWVRDEDDIQQHGPKEDQ